MKKYSYILWGALMLITLGACSEKKKSNVIITHKPVAKAPKKTQKMSDYEQSREVEWLGSTYKVVVKRASDAQLPIVKLDESNKYYDNKIQLRILRKDGTEFFNRTFTKSDFGACLDKHTMDNGALLGIVFVKAVGDCLNFAASVGSPDVTSDEYMPLVLHVSRMGSVTISKDHDLDAGGGEEDEKAPSAEDEADV